VGGALAAGCSLILKASEETPVACVEMVRCFVDAGLPAGVLNLVFGVPSERVRTSARKDAVRKISFTGSIPVGKHLAQLAAKGMKRTTMELGGHSPVVVFADADPEKAGRHHRRVQVSQRRPGLHLADALLRAGGCLSALPQALHRIRQWQ
jgi:succinate-semialdehyde dehydrogenase/glutarate-semialdehyde dehydrogenase